AVGHVPRPAGDLDVLPLLPADSGEVAVQGSLVQHRDTACLRQVQDLQHPIPVHHHRDVQLIGQRLFDAQLLEEAHRGGGPGPVAAHRGARDDLGDRAPMRHRDAGRGQGEEVVVHVDEPVGHVRVGARCPQVLRAVRPFAGELATRNAVDVANPLGLVPDDPHPAERAVRGEGPQRLPQLITALLRPYHVHDIHQEPISILTARTSSSSAPDSSGSSAGSNTPVSGSRNPTSVTAAQPVQESRMNRSSTSSGSNTRTVRIAKPLNDWVAPHGAPAGTSGASVAWVNAVWWNANASSGARAGTDTTSNPAILPITASRSAESEPDWSTRLK